MALTRTVLTAVLKANDLLMTVASTATGFPALGTVNANQPAVIDNETVFITGVPNSTQAVIRGRGSEGSRAIQHDIGSPVVTSSVVSDFPALALGQSIINPLTEQDQLTYGQDGAIAVPLRDTIAFLAKSSAAAAMTLGAPSLAQNGLRLIITSATAFAHVITATGLYDTGAAGSPFSTATFPAQLGASVSLIAQNGVWNVQAVNGAVVFT